MVVKTPTWYIYCSNDGWNRRRKFIGNFLNDDIFTVSCTLVLWHLICALSVFLTSYSSVFSSPPQKKKNDHGSVAPFGDRDRHHCSQRLTVWRSSIDLLSLRCNQSVRPCPTCFRGLQVNMCAVQNTQHAEHQSPWTCWRHANHWMTWCWTCRPQNGHPAE